MSEGLRYDVNLIRDEVAGRRTRQAHARVAAFCMLLFVLLTVLTYAAYYALAMDTRAVSRRIALQFQSVAGAADAQPGREAELKAEVAALEEAVDRCAEVAQGSVSWPAVMVGLQRACEGRDDVALRTVQSVSDRWGVRVEVEGQCADADPVAAVQRLLADMDRTDVFARGSVLSIDDTKRDCPTIFRVQVPLEGRTEPAPAPETPHEQQ